MFDPAHETQPTERLRDLQLRKLQASAGEVLAPRGNAFIRRKWAAAGGQSAGDLMTWDDVHRLPFTLKQEFVTDQAECPPFGPNLTYPLQRYHPDHQTHGSSGPPLRLAGPK